MNRYGLTNITLHNSYYSNLTVSIKTDGHTNCSGTNAAGKTTMLRVLALFYGCRPSRFDARATDKKPFQEHVLPTASSLLIYDYQREDGEYCVAVYRNNNGLVYRFLKGHSRDVFFNESTGALLKEGKAATDIFTHLIKQQVDKDAVSSQVTTISDYAAIIQNNVPRHRRRNQSGRNLHYLAQKYCLGVRGSDMRLMGELSYTLIKRSQMFERLKQMVVETQFSYEPPKVPKHKGNTKLSANLRSLRTFAVHEPIIRKAIVQHRERLSLQNIILRHVRGIVSGRNDLASQIAADEDHLLSLRAQKEQVQATYETERDALSQKASDCQHRLKSLTKDITKADAEYENWLEADMGTKKEEFAQLDNYCEREQQAQSHYKALLDNQKGLIEDRDRRINAIESSRLENIQKHRDRIDDLKVEIDKCKDRYETYSNEIRREYSRREETLRAAWEDKRTPLIQQIARLETLEQSLVPTEAEMLEEASASEGISEIDSNIERLETDLERAKIDMDAAKSLRTSRAEALRERDRQLASAKRKVEELERLCHPPEKSLLRELRNNVPDWTETIGRLIQPELLERKDLAPDFVETQIDGSFYGLILDLEKIDKSDVAQGVEALQERLDIAQAYQRNAEGARKSAEEQLQEAVEALRQAELSQGEVDLQRRAAANARREATHYLKGLQSRHKDNLQQRRQDIKDERKAQQAELDAAKRDFEQALKSAMAQRDKAVNDALAVRSEETGDLEDKIRSRESSIEAVQLDAIEQSDEIQLTYKQKMADQDVDEAALSRAKQRWDEAAAKVREVQNYREDLYTYNHWLSRTWAEVPKQREEQNVLTETLEQMQRELEQMHRDHRREMNAFDDRLKSTEGRLRAENELLGTATTLLTQVGEAPPGEAAEGTLEYLCQNLQSLLSEQQQVKSQVIDSVRQAKESIYTTPESRVYEAWKLLVEARKDSSGYEEYSDAFLLQLPEDLETLLNRSIPQIRAAQIETVKAVGSTYVDFYQKLDSLAKEVSRVSRQLKQKINTDQRIGSLSNIELVLESRIHTAIDGWEQLKLFVEEFSGWHSIMSNELPPESLEEALESVIVLIDPETVQTKIESLVDMKIKMTESGRPTEVTSDESFEDSSSNGLSYLALIVIFVGLSRYLCPNHEIQLTWPIDELASLDPMNVSSLFTMLNHNNIWMLSAFPSTDFNLLQHFEHRYLLDRATGVREFTGNSEISDEEIDDVLSALPEEENA